jgi:hypothetical protein
MVTFVKGLGLYFSEDGRLVYVVLYRFVTPCSLARHTCTIAILLKQNTAILPVQPCDVQSSVA